MALHRLPFAGLAFALVAMLGTLLFGNEHSQERPGIANRRAHRHESRTLLLPRAPVKVIHIEGTDILIIVGAGGTMNPNRPAPVGPVSVEAVEELDLLIIRSHRSSGRRN